jgi:hypothetical protein
VRSLDDQLLEGVVVNAERRNVPALVEISAPLKPSSFRSTLAMPAAIAAASDSAGC